MRVKVNWIEKGEMINIVVLLLELAGAVRLLTTMRTLLDPESMALSENVSRLFL